MPLIFNEAEHSYTLDGVRLPSVTQIINAILPVYQAAEWHLQRGTATHHGCRLLDEGRLDWSTVDPEIEPRIRAWEKFRRDFPAAELIACERPMASAKCRFAGTMDRMFDRMGKLTVIDIKNSVSAQVRLQLGAYSLLWKESTGKQVDTSAAIELTEDGKYKAYWFDKNELRRNEQQFIACLTVFNFAQQHDLLRKT